MKILKSIRIGAITIASMLLILGAVRRFQGEMLLAIDDNLMAIALILFVITINFKVEQRERTNEDVGTDKVRDEH